MATMTKPGGVLAMVAGMATTKPKKDAKPEVSDPSLDGLIEKRIEQKRALDDAEAALMTTDDQLIAAIGPKRLEACRRMGKVESSVRVNKKLTLTQKAQYCEIPQEREADLAAAFGEKARVYFPARVSLSLTDEAAQDEGVLQALVDALGPERFGQVFKAKRTLVVSEAFHTDVTLSEEVEQLAAPFLADQTIKPYRATLKQ